MMMMMMTLTITNSDVPNSRSPKTVHLTPAIPDPRVKKICQTLNHMFSKLISFNFPIRNNKNLHIINEICLSLEIRYSGVPL